MERTGSHARFSIMKVPSYVSDGKSPIREPSPKDARWSSSANNRSLLDKTEILKNTILPVEKQKGSWWNTIGKK